MMFCGPKAAMPTTQKNNCHGKTSNTSMKRIKKHNTQNDRYGSVQALMLNNERITTQKIRKMRIKGPKNDEVISVTGFGCRTLYPSFLSKSSRGIRLFFLGLIPPQALLNF
mmetsp:Transcript_30627/g.46380  ORF Transcript_30627/g.46380 Transcript_30627/m.46380 type:complete len:111 (+) Transcript_30627:3434-3766(+)